MLIGIVTYNPEDQRLRDNLSAIRQNVPQVPIVITDNGSDNINTILLTASEYPQCTVIQLGENKGIATALNRIFQYASDNTDATWVMTMDQDSVWGKDAINKMLKHRTDDDVAILCPRITDRNMGEQNSYSEETEEIEYCITSGNLVRTRAWEDAGGFDQQMFIDGVDFDFCLSVKKNGWKIKRVNGAQLIQEVGHGRAINIGSHQISILNHSALRLAYIVRNYLYLGRKHDRLLHWATEVIKRFIIVAAFEHPKRKKLKAMWKGLRMYQKGEMDKINSI